MTTSLATALPRVEDQDLLDRVIAEQGGRPGSLLSILEKLQEQHRNKYLPMETLEYVAARTGVPQARVYSVATFYALFNLEPQGTHTVEHLPRHRLPHPRLARAPRAAEAAARPLRRADGRRAPTSSPSPPRTGASPSAPWPASASARSPRSSR